MNRFDKRARLQSTYQPIAPTANFELLAKSLQVQQNTYDKALDAYSKVPDYIRESDQASAEAKQYREGQQQRIQNMTDAFTSGGIQKGNIARKEGMRSLLQDFQPGGVGNKLETDAKRYQSYMEQLDKDLADDRITPDVHQKAKQKSLKDFDLAYGNKTPFSGYQTAANVDLTKMADDFLTGWQPNIIAGKPVKVLNGEFYYAGTTEKVTPQEIQQAALEYLQAQPEAQAYLQQLDTLFESNAVDDQGNTIPNSMLAMNDAINANARKHSKLQETGKYIKNWAVADARGRAHDKRNDGNIFGSLYNSGVINAPMGKIDLEELGTQSKAANDLVMSAKQRLLELQGRALIPGQSPATEKQLRRAKESVTKAEATFEGFEKQEGAEAWRTKGKLSYIMSPEAQGRFPGIKQAATSLQRKEDETSDQYGQRVIDTYNKAVDASSQYVVRSKGFGDGIKGAKAKKESTNRILGASGVGELYGMKVQLVGPDGTFKDGVSFEELMNSSGYEEDDGKTAWQQFRENADIVGLVEDGAGQVVEGSVNMRFTDPGGKIYEAYVNTENTASHQWRKPLQEARSGYRDFDVSLTKPIMMAVGQDEQGNIQSAQVQFKYGFDKGGNRTRVMIDPETGLQIPGDPTSIERNHQELMPEFMRQIQNQ
jgi:soluble cytochrome b562